MKQKQAKTLSNSAYSEPSTRGQRAVDDRTTGEHEQISSANRVVQDAADEQNTNGLSAVLDKLAAAPLRNERGQFVRGITKTLEHSETFWAEVEPLKQGIVDGVRAQLGVEAVDGITTLDSVIDGYAEARLLRQATFARMVEQGGPLTGKGKRRAIVDVWCAFFDREQRAAERIGLTRRPRKTQTPAEWLTSLAPTNQEQSVDAASMTETADAE